MLTSRVRHTRNLFFMNLCPLPSVEVKASRVPTMFHQSADFGVATPSRCSDRHFLGLQLKKLKSCYQSVTTHTVITIGDLDTYPQYLLDYNLISLIWLY